MTGQNLPANKALRAHRNKAQAIEPPQGRGSPQQLATADHDAISRQHLDRRQSIRAKKPLKRNQLTLPLKHQPHDLTLRLVIALHRLGA